MSEVKQYVSTTDENGGVNISQDVVAVIAGSAALEVEGVASLHPVHSRDVGDLVARKGFARSIRTVINGDKLTLDVSIIAEVGSKVASVGNRVQKLVSEAVENSVGIKPEAVNVHISGVSLKKSRQ